MGAKRPTFVLCEDCAMKLTEKWVQEVIDRHVENVELVALEDVGNRRHRVVRLFIDHPAGVSHDLCAQVSGFMGAALDEAGSLDAPYTLEVSSPGLDRPLTKPAHFHAQVGRKVTVRTQAPVQGRSVWQGILREVRDGEITLADGGKEIVIDLGDISKANLVYEFEQGRGDE